MSLPLDMPDNYPWLPGSMRAPVTDVGEAAVRLGSSVAYDRRGSVYWLWDGNTGLSPFATLPEGSGAAVRVIANDTEPGGYAIELTAGEGYSGAASLYKHWTPIEQMRLGAECNVFIPSDFLLFSVDVCRFTGTEKIEMYCDLDYFTNEITILPVGGYTVAVADLPDPLDLYGLYHNLKIVGDLEELRYVRLLYDQVELDLSEYEIPVVADSSPPCLTLWLTLWGVPSSNARCQIGRVILTIGEP